MTNTIKRVVCFCIGAMTLYIGVLFFFAGFIVVIDNLFGFYNIGDLDVRIFGFTIDFNEYIMNIFVGSVLMLAGLIVLSKYRLCNTPC